MALIPAGKPYTHTQINKDLRSISSTFVNQTQEAIETDDCTFEFQGKDETFMSCSNTGFRRIAAQTAFVGIQYTDFANVFGMPKELAAKQAETMGAERLAKQKELYGA